MRCPASAFTRDNTEGNISNEKETKVSALDAKAKALANEEDEDTKIAKLLKNMPKWRFYSLAVLTVIWTVF